MKHPWKPVLLILLSSGLLTGCPAPAADAAPAASPAEKETEEETFTCNGIVKKRSELSGDTIEWLDWYQSLPQEQQDALNFVPSEFSAGQAATAETSADSAGADETSVPSRSPVAEAKLRTESGSYYYLLTDEELAETEEMARHYFTELAPEYGGVVGIRPAEDSSPLYRNKGIEDEYAPGNIIIYYVMTGLDEKEGNPMRSISIARRSKSDDWKVINSGH